MPAEPNPSRNRQALLLGLTGVVIFGLTLPATRLAVADFNPLFVTAGRSVVAESDISPPRQMNRNSPATRSC